MHASSNRTMSEFQMRSGAVTMLVPWAEILVGSLFAICLVGLTHDIENLATSNENSVEAGRDMEDIEAFHKNVNTAPMHRKMSFLGLLSIACYCLATAPRNTKIQNYAVLVSLVGCLTWLAASFLWSVDWRHTMREFVRIGAYAFVAIAMALRFRPQRLCWVMLLAVFGSVLTACAASLFSGNFRPWASDFRLHGTLHTNLLAHQALVVLLIAVALFPSAKRGPAAKRVWFWRIVILSALSVILLSKTRGALASALVGITAISLVGRPIRSIAFTGSILATLVLAGSLLIVVAGSQAQDRVQEMLTLGRSEGVGTLTGRIPLWEAVWQESQGRHWQGYGYGAFWSIEQTEKLFEELKWYPRHSHSAYVHTILDLGYIGLGLLLTLVAWRLASSRLGGDISLPRTLLTLFTLVFWRQG